LLEPAGSTPTKIILFFYGPCTYTFRLLSILLFESCLRHLRAVSSVVYHLAPIFILILIHTHTRSNTRSSAPLVSVKRRSLVQTCSPGSPEWISKCGVKGCIVIYSIKQQQKKHDEGPEPGGEAAPSASAVLLLLLLGIQPRHLTPAQAHNTTESPRQLTMTLGMNHLPPLARPSEPGTGPQD
jgi:hypothetical protein